TATLLTNGDPAMVGGAAYVALSSLKPPLTDDTWIAPSAPTRLTYRRRTAFVIARAFNPPGRLARLNCTSAVDHAATVIVGWLPKLFVGLAAFTNASPVRNPSAAAHSGTRPSTTTALSADLP